MLRNYRNIYSDKDIMAKRLCFSAAMVSFHPLTVISSMNAPRSNPILLSSFSDAQMKEIEDYISNYNDKLYVIEANNYIYLIIPALFPTSTSCLILRMDIAPNVFLRFVREKEELFTLSSNISTSPARMSKRLDAEKKDFLELCTEIERTFMHLERFNLSFDDEEVIYGYYEQVISISSFLGVPINDISVNVADDGVPIKSNFALFTTFCTTMMMLAKNEAIDRKINVALEIFGGSVIVNMSFKPEKNIRVTNETFLWDFLASNKKMLFNYHNSDGLFRITFEPLFIDWSYLGIKQTRNADMLFDE